MLSPDKGGWTYAFCGTKRGVAYEISEAED